MGLLDTFFKGKGTKENEVVNPASTEAQEDQASKPKKRRPSLWSALGGERTRIGRSKSSNTTSVLVSPRPHSTIPDGASPTVNALISLSPMKHQVAQTYPLNAATSIPIPADDNESVNVSEEKKDMSSTTSSPTAASNTEQQADPSSNSQKGANENGTTTTTFGSSSSASSSTHAPTNEDEIKIAPKANLFDIVSEPLYRAAIEGDLATIQKYIAESNTTELNKGCKEYELYTALHFAALRNHIEVCKVLLEANVQVDAVTKVDSTPLHVACSKGHQEVARLLLSFGADVMKRDAFGSAPLHLAIKGNHLAVAKDLIDLARADVNYKKCTDSKTLMHIACEKGLLQAVEFLIENDAAANIKDDKGNSPLLLAVKHNNKEIVKFLGTSKDIKPECNFSVQNNFGQTVLHIAAEQGSLEIVELLIQLKPKLMQKLINDPDKLQKWTPLFYAVNKMDADMVGLLIRHGADMNIKDEKGRYLLHMFLETPAAKVNDHVLMKLLECPKTDISVKNANKETAKQLLKKVPKYQKLLKLSKSLRKLYNKTMDLKTTE